MVENYLDLLSDLDKNPQQLLCEWRQKANAVKSAFLTEDLHRRKAEDPGEFINYLKDVFSATALFMDDAMKEKLKNIGLDWLVLQWTIPIEDILAELDRIEASGEASLPRTQVLLFIKAHIDVSWLTDLQIAFGYTDTVNKKLFSPLLKAIIHRLYRNRHKPRGKFPTAKNSEEQKIINLILALELLTGRPELVEKLLKQLISGNTKKIFLWLIVTGDEVHPRTNRFYRSFYNLFQLINPHIHFLSKEEYESHSENAGMGYPVFQAKFIKRLVR